jgi:hypothetical protein
MLDPTKLLDSIQSEWPLLPSLALVGIADRLPHWAISSAQRGAVRLSPGEVLAYRSRLPRLAERFAALYRRWVVAAVLAVLLALAVVATAAAAPLDSLHLGILSGVLCAILLPPLVICNGIARDYVAARALAAALAGTVQTVS